MKRSSSLADLSAATYVRSMETGDDEIDFDDCVSPFVSGSGDPPMTAADVRAAVRELESNPIPVSPGGVYFVKVHPENMEAAIELAADGVIQLLAWEPWMERHELGR